MKNFKDLSIKQKIGLGYVVMIICCFIVAIIAFSQLGRGSRPGLMIVGVNVIAIIFAILYSNKVVKEIIKPLKKAQFAVEELGRGHLDVRTENDAQDEIGELSRSLDEFIIVFRRDLIGAIDLIAEGDITNDFPLKDERDEIAVILNKISNTVRRINQGMGRLINDVSNGDLETRGDIHLFGGVWSDFIGNINKLIEAFVKPIHVTGDYVTRISKGDIPPKITEEYKGDFNEIKNSLNECIDIVNGLVGETGELIEAASAGQLDRRGNEQNFSGEWKRLIAGINKLVETVVTPIHEISDTMGYVSCGNLEVSVKGNYKGQFGELSDSVNTTIIRLRSVVEEISKILGAISEGNLAIDQIQKFDGNFESISVSLNKIVESLNTTLGEIRSAADQVSIGSVQVADGSQLLAQGATEQASSIEELTASITQIAAQTKENAENANSANAVVHLMKENADKGNGHMNEMLEAMTEINEASANISKVIKVIDDMAFQTNILALNAAVEAARAGQYGKGFAVVAEEVRNLAARSANAAKETTSLIEGSIQRAKRGEEIANETAKALVQIAAGVEDAAGLISGIAVSSNEQASGISQINIGINQVSQVVQTNSATSEESAAASEELSGQADLLKSLVEEFTLKNRGSGMPQSMRREHFDRKKQDKNIVSNKPQIILSDSEFGKY